MIHQPAMYSDGIRIDNDIKIIPDYVEKNKQRENKILFENTDILLKKLEKICIDV